MSTPHEPLRVFQNAVDLDTDSAYLSFNTDAAAAQKVPYSDRVFVDLDTTGRAVGVQIVSVSNTWFDSEDFCQRYNLDASVADDLWRAHMNAGLGHKDPAIAREFRALSHVMDGLQGLGPALQLRVLRRAFDRLDEGFRPPAQQ